MKLKLRTVDYVIISSVVLILFVGILIGLKLNKFSKSPIQSEESIAFQVFLRNVVLTSEKLPLKRGDDTYLTIRNVPYKKLKVLEAIAIRKMVSVSNPTGNLKQGALMVEDVSAPFQYDMIVTVTDKAKVTEDGFVAGGNKIKIGIPVVIEGQYYKLNGVVSNVQQVDEQIVKKILQQPQEQSTQQVVDNVKQSIQKK